MLEHLRDARRGAAFLCQLFSVDHRRPLGVVSDIPELAGSPLSGLAVACKLTDSTLIYSGPLPTTCPCALPHRPTKGAKSVTEFHTADAVLMGSLFWQRCFHDLVSDLFPSTLRDGGSQFSVLIFVFWVLPFLRALLLPRVFSSRPGSGCDVSCAVAHRWALMSKFLDVPITKDIFSDSRSASWQHLRAQQLVALFLFSSLARSLPATVQWLTLPAVMFLVVFLRLLPSLSLVFSPFVERMSARRPRDVGNPPVSAGPVAVRTFFRVATAR